MPQEFTSHSEAETITYAQNLVQELKPGTILALTGDLGAGKTTFCRALIQTLISDQPVRSPSFTIMREYQHENFPGGIIHLDFYRIESAEDLKVIDLSEIFNRNDNLVLIEWPEKIKDNLPEKTYFIDIDIIDEQQRKIMFRTFDLTKIN